MSTLRRCRYCRLILDVRAPAHGPMIQGSYDGKADRRVRPHCAESHICDWCEDCWQRRCSRIDAGLNPDTGDPWPIAPDTMT